MMGMRCGVAERDDDLDQEMVAKAEAVIAGMKGAYLDWVTQDLLRLEGLWAEVASARVEKRTLLMLQIFTIAHDVKGQGGSFGYDLMTAVGNHLCRVIEVREEWPDASLALVRKLLDALTRILAEGLEGDGGTVGRALMSQLCQDVEAAGGPLTLT
jgi:chemotaxis protein histidine kinase CheA